MTMFNVHVIMFSDFYSPEAIENSNLKTNTHCQALLPVN